MPVIAVTGRKGGIGKSTLTANLAAELYNMGRKVLAFDTDPQKSLVAWSRLGDGVLSLCVEPLETEHPEQFRRRIAAAEKTVDRVLIDTPPGFADPALLASLVADLVLIPCGPSPLDLLAAREALTMTLEARRRRGGVKPLIRFIPSRVMTNTNLGRDLPGSLADLGEKVLPGITQRIAIAEAALTGLTIAEYAPGSPAQDEFKALAIAIERLIR